MRSTLTVLGTSALVAVAAATAQAATAPPSGLLVLNSSTQNALTLSGGATVQVPVVSVNSTSSKAVNIASNTVMDAANLQVMGGVTLGSSSLTGALTKLAAPAPDPLAGLSFKLPALPDQGAKSITGKTITLSPGYYSGGIVLGGGANVNFQPGVYYLAGKGLTASACTMTAPGVVFVIEAGTVSLSGGCAISLSPPTSGAFAGIAIAQAPINKAKVTLSGGSEMQISGTIYAPKALISLGGGSGVVGQTPLMGDYIIGDTVTLAGKGFIKIGSAPPPPPSNTTPLSPPMVTGLFD